MSSNYAALAEDEEVRVIEDERPCARCRGMGTVLVRGHETDCLACEGYGSVIV